MAAHYPAHTLNLLGLLFSIVGATMIFFFGPPMPSFEPDRDAELISVEEINGSANATARIGAELVRLLPTLAKA